VSGPVLTDVAADELMSYGLPTTPKIWQLEFGSLLVFGMTVQVASVLAPLRTKSKALSISTVGVSTVIVADLVTVPPIPSHRSEMVFTPGVGKLTASAVAEVPFEPLQVPSPEAVQVSAQSLVQDTKASSPGQTLVREISRVLIVGGG